MCCPRQAPRRKFYARRLPNQGWEEGAEKEEEDAEEAEAAEEEDES